MNGQQVPSGPEMTESRIFFEAQFAGPWVVDGR